jgi:hypothetical protein
VVPNKSAVHRDAAARHELAAANHERAAKFWDERHDRERAQLQREMAEYERRGAVLERRWGALTDPDADPSDRDADHREMRTAELVRRHTRQSAEQASRLLMLLAMGLERSARLADEHANRLERGGSAEGAEPERQAAKRAREEAQNARRQAEAWLKIGKNPKH